MWIRVGQVAAGDEADARRPADQPANELVRLTV